MLSSRTVRSPNARGDAFVLRSKLPEDLCAYILNWTVVECHVCRVRCFPHTRGRFCSRACYEFC